METLFGVARLGQLCSFLYPVNVTLPGPREPAVFQAARAQLAKGQGQSPLTFLDRRPG